MIGAPSGVCVLGVSRLAFVFQVALVVVVDQHRARDVSQVELAARPLFLRDCRHRRQGGRALRQLGADHDPCRGAHQRDRDRLRYASAS